MRLYVRLFIVFVVILETSCCGSWSLEHGVGFRRRGLLTGLTGDEWRSWVLQRHLWRTHIVASPGEKTEQSGNTGGISYCDVISHKTFSFSQMKQGGQRGKRWRGRATGRDGGGTKGGQRSQEKISRRGDGDERQKEERNGLPISAAPHSSRIPTAVFLHELSKESNFTLALKGSQSIFKS